jgi:hypothetical protein
MTMAKREGREAAETKAARVVIVLGRKKKIDLKPFVDRVWRARVPLVIINLGFPLTPSQQKVVDAALEAAGTGVIALDAVIAYDPRQAVSFLHDGDEIVYAAARAERREVERAQQML